MQVLAVINCPMKEISLLALFIILFGCTSQNAKEQEFFDQADKIIGLIKEKNFEEIRKSTHEMRYKTSITDTGWINYASRLIKKYMVADHSRWTLKKTDMGYEVHIPLLNVEEPDIMYKSFDFVLLHTPNNISDKFYDFRLEGDLKSAKKIPVEAPK
jgi:hypothetical protein